MLHSGLTQSGFSQAILVHRSAVSQLLSNTTARLPNAQVIAACATVLNVSADWLLSLSDCPESAAELLADALSLTTAPRALVDEQVLHGTKRPPTISFAMFQQRCLICSRPARCLSGNMPRIWAGPAYRRSMPQKIVLLGCAARPQILKSPYRFMNWTALSMPKAISAVFRLRYGRLRLIIW